MWRELGDTYNLLSYVSQACYLTPLASLNPKPLGCIRVPYRHTVNKEDHRRYTRMKNMCNYLQ